MARTSYRLNDSFISLDEAKKLGWAKLRDGSPTALYLRILDQRTKMKGKKRRKEMVHSSFGEYSGISSPFKLDRRSGYKTIWQVLAEKSNSLVPWSIIQGEVNERLSTEEKSKSWYFDNYIINDFEYDAKSNCIMISRHPYNVRIERLSQRVLIGDEGATLLTNVSFAREFKKRGRKSLNIV